MRSLVLVASAILLAFASWLFLLPSRVPDLVDLPHTYDGSHPAMHINDTLGFERIIVLNLPRRVDRRDIMTLMARASGFLFEYFAAKSGHEMKDYKLPPMKLLPYIKRIHDVLTPGQVGCYRSNLDIMRYIVHNGISSALILQDDAEWDVNIRQSLTLLQGRLFRIFVSITH